MQEFHHSQSWQGKNKKHKLMWNWASKRERQVGDKQNSHSQNEQPRQQDAELVQTRCCGAALKSVRFPKSQVNMVQSGIILRKLLRLEALLLMVHLCDMMGKAHGIC